MLSNIKTKALSAATKASHGNLKKNILTAARIAINPEPTASHAVYKAAGADVSFESDLSMPVIQQPTDAIVKMVKTTICGTDLHILGGNVHSCKPGTRIGHEGIGEIVDVGQEVNKRMIGQRILINTTTSCGKCANCQKQFYGHCEDGGWKLGNEIDGLQGTYARVPHVDHSSQIIPKEIWGTEIEDDLVMCSDILPTGLEVGLLDGDIKPGMTIAIVGAGPVGLASLICSSMYPPKDVFIIDMNEHRLRSGEEMGSTPGLENTGIHTINNNDGKAVSKIMEMTEGHGVDLVVEAIGNPAGWYICQDIVKAGGHIAMLGVHGKSATINLERMWYRNFKFTAGLVHGFTIPMLMDRILAGKLPARKLISHRLPLSEIEAAYYMFKNAAHFSTLKILLENDLD